MRRSLFLYPVLACLMVEEVVKRLSLLWLMALPLVAFFVLGASPTTFAIDAEQSLRNVRRHEAWMSMDFRDPFAGMYRASRAASEDKESEVTLTVSAGIDRHTRRCAETMDIIFKTHSLIGESVEREGLVEIQIDNRPPFLLTGTLSMTAGEQFVHFGLDRSLPIQQLSQGKTVLTNVRGMGVATFSLRGFTKAYRYAKKTCRDFEMPESNAK